MIDTTPVCYQVRMYSTHSAMWGSYVTYHNREDRDRAAEAYRSQGLKVETRELYDSPSVLNEQLRKLVRDLVAVSPGFEDEGKIAETWSAFARAKSMLGGDMPNKKNANEPAAEMVEISQKDLLLLARGIADNAHFIDQSGAIGRDGGRFCSFCYVERDPITGAVQPHKDYCPVPIAGALMNVEI